MKTLRHRLLLALSAVFLMAAPLTYAQNKPERPEGAERRDRGDRLKMLTEYLELTPAQVEKLKPIMKAEMESLKALRDDSTLDGKAKREKMRDIRETNRNAMEAVLTPAQKEKLASMPRGPGGPGEKPAK